MSSWQTPGDLTDRLGDAYRADQFFDDHNVEKRFNDLLEDLEAEARAEIENRLGDEPITEETGREDTVVAPDTATIQLAYPVNDVTEVKTRQSSNTDWADVDALDDRRYTHTSTRVVLLGASTTGRRNPLRVHADRRTWRDLAREVRVTYDRGHDPVPANLVSAQTDMIRRALRGLRQEQNVAAIDPEQLSAIAQANVVLTDDLVARIDSVEFPTRKHSVI